MLYRGDFLDGFFVSDASPRFDHWLDRERALLRERALRAAWQLAEQEESRGNAMGAAQLARRATDLHATNDFSIRKLIELLAHHGDLRECARMRPLPSA